MFRSGLGTLRGNDPDRLLGISTSRKKPVGDLLPRPVRHVDGLSSIRRLLGSDQAAHEILRTYGLAGDLLHTLMLNLVVNLPGRCLAALQLRLYCKEMYRAILSDP